MTELAPGPHPRAFPSQGSVPVFGALLDPVLAPLQSLARAVSTASSRLNAWCKEHEDAIDEVISTLTVLGVAATRPDNWRELDTRELLLLHKIAVSDEICLVWVPRSGVVRQLLEQADRDARCRVLVERRDEILDDCEAAIAFDAENFTPVPHAVATLVGKSISAARNGHPEAAQSLASSMLSAVIHEVLGLESQRAARQLFEESCSDAEFRLFMLRESVLFGATARVLTRTEAALAGFNRHATAHGHLDSFGSAHMLEAVMLAAAWVREISFQATQVSLHSAMPVAGAQESAFEYTGRRRSAGALSVIHH